MCGRKEEKCAESFPFVQKNAEKTMDKKRAVLYNYIIKNREFFPFSVFRREDGKTKKKNENEKPIGGKHGTNVLVMTRTENDTHPKSQTLLGCISPKGNRYIVLIFRLDYFFKASSAASSSASSASSTRSSASCAFCVSGDADSMGSTSVLPFSLRST